MLKTRLLTALLAGTLLVVSLFLLNTMAIGVVLGIFTVIAAFEWGSLSGLNKRRALLFSLGVALVGIASLQVPLIAVLTAAMVWWLWAILEVFMFAELPGPLWCHKSLRLLSGILVLVPTWRACVALKAENSGHPWLLVLVLAMVWSADSLAYFTGRAYGRHKLAPLVSPGKSWEGAVGGLVGAAFIGALGAVLSDRPLGAILEGVVFGAVVAAFSVVGDLLESKAKRLAGVKDSGRWLPGHGGILDRIDALTAAVPIFVVGVGWWGVR